MKKHKTNYGPAMTRRLKEQLEAEIKVFDKTSTKRVIERAAVGKPDIEAYQNWFDNHNGQEDPRANPDLLSENDTIPWGGSSNDIEIQRAIDELPQILTHRELQVWRLVMREGKSVTQAGERLRVSQQMASKLLAKAKLKVERYFK